MDPDDNSTSSCMSQRKTSGSDATATQAEIEAVFADMAAARVRTKNFTVGAPITPADILIAGSWGAAAAGGLYPFALVILDGVFQQTFSWLTVMGLAFVAILVGFVWGFLAAAVVGLPIVGALWFAVKFCRVPVAWHAHVAATAGGLTGLIGALPIRAFAAETHSQLFGDVVLATAIVMGQVGAWWAASKRARSVALSNPRLEVDSPTDVKFSLGQLFRITTVVCIAATGLAVLNLPPQTYAVLAFGVAVQFTAFAALVGYMTMRRTARRFSARRATGATAR